MKGNFGYSMDVVSGIEKGAECAIMSNNTVQQLLSNCLYFTANRLERVMNRMAEEEFRTIGLSPTYGYLLMAIIEMQGATQKELSQVMHLAPSTITRFIEKLQNKNLVYSQQEGRISRIFPTDKGLSLRPEIEAAWDRLHDRYAAILGRKEGDELTLRIDEAARKLDEK